RWWWGWLTGGLWGWRRSRDGETGTGLVARVSGSAARVPETPETLTGRILQPFKRGRKSRQAVPAQGHLFS
ncbi:MAG: hypothetical protein NTW87_10715, partial [Planctomycetota bacterium]|nr:hypothetical protein [Planctomycetota bacterium]